MSPYIVDREHIVYLVQAAASRALGFNSTASALFWTWNANHEKGTYYQETLHESADLVRIGNVLWDENRESVCCRYHDIRDLPGPIGEDCTLTTKDFDIPVHEINSVQVIKACHCYAYQACEHPEWESSEAYAFIQALIKRATMALPGYEKAEWGVPKRKEAIVK